MAIELFMDDDYSDSVGANTTGYWEKFKHFDYTVTSNEIFEDFGENCIEF